MDREVRTADELTAAGGRMYACADGYYCDLNTSSWKWVQGIGFVRLDAAGRMPVPRIEVNYPLRRSHHRTIETVLA